MLLKSAFYSYFSKIIMANNFFMMRAEKELRLFARKKEDSTKVKSSLGILKIIFQNEKKKTHLFPSQAFEHHKTVLSFSC